MANRGPASPSRRGPGDPYGLLPRTGLVAPATATRKAGYILGSNFILGAHGKALANVQVSMAFVESAP